MNSDWQGQAFEQQIQASAVQFIHAACYVVENHAKRLLSVSGTGGGQGKKRRYGSNPSRPGEPPRKQRGTLRSSVAHVVKSEEMKGYVGTRYKYGLYLELGTSKIAARPWLRRAIAEKQPQLQALLKRIGRA